MIAQRTRAPTRADRLRKADLVQMQAKDASFGGLTGGPVAGLRRLFVL